MQTYASEPLEELRETEQQPLFSIVTVSYKDAWALTKTARSVFCQSNTDFEYIIVDGDSADGTAGLVQFWAQAGLVNRFLIEPDHGVYDAMNKAMWLARGKYLCYMNAGDVFSHNDVLGEVSSVLEGDAYDGCLGWGELNGSIWASWIESTAFKLSSLGFCHQALFVKTDLLRKNKFSSAPGKTDSDTLQLARLYAAGKKIPIVPEVWAKRGGEPGISSDLERSRKSIIGTLTSEYPEIDVSTAKDIIRFRRACEGYERVISLMENARGDFATHLALMVLDTLFLRQSRTLPDSAVKILQRESVRLLLCERPGLADSAIERLIFAQKAKIDRLRENKKQKDRINLSIKKFKDQELKRRSKSTSEKNKISIKKEVDYNIFLTTFPPRIGTLEFVIESLLSQTIVPKSIYVIIGKDEVPNRNWLPSSLLQFESRGLRLHFVNKTCHQYDKFLHLRDLNDDEPYVIVDDDVLYHPNSMEHLLLGHANFPNAIIGNRCHLMAYDDEAGRFEPYQNWQREQRFEAPSHRLFPTGAGGVLYPPKFFAPYWVSKTESILSVAPYADDIWLKLCAIIQNRPTYATPLSEKGSWYYRYTPTMMEGTLMATNVEKGLNDLQIRAGERWLDQARPGWRNLYIGSVAADEAVL